MNKIKKEIIKQICSVIYNSFTLHSICVDSNDFKSLYYDIESEVVAEGNFYVLDFDLCYTLILVLVHDYPWGFLHKVGINMIIKFLTRCDFM